MAWFVLRLGILKASNLVDSVAFLVIETIVPLPVPLFHLWGVALLEGATAGMLGCLLSMLVDKARWGMQWSNLAASLLISLAQIPGWRYLGS